MLKKYSLKNNQPFNAIPFQKVQSDQFLSELQEAIQLHQKEVDDILQNPNGPNFENTVEALEHSGFELERLSSTYYNLFSACSDDPINQISDEFSTKLTEHSNNIQLHPQLFQRIKAVYDNEFSSLTGEKKTLLEKYYKDFTRNGALLDEDKKEQLRQIDEKLASLSPQFSKNLLEATNAFTLQVDNKEDIEGLPQSALSEAKELASQKGQPDSWIFTLQAPSYIPFMTFCPNRGLREKLWRAYNQRTFGGKYSNNEICSEVTALRTERAQLLGYESHAHFVLERRMAKTSQQVYQFLDSLKEPSLKSARKDVEEVTQHAKTLGIEAPLMPWDFGYCSEKLKEKKFSYKEEELRPYFPLEGVLNGLFEHASKLFQLEISPTNKVDTYHDDVRTFEVKEDGETTGLLYVDLFPRDNKRGGAWMTSFQEQSSSQASLLPLVSIVCNFTKPTKELPSLLTFNEVETLFHEFGHALHGLLSKCHYPSLSGTNVLWDFVELPSQIMENWCLEKETLHLFAKHHKTGELLPEDLIEKLRASKNFMSGYANLRQLSFGLLDMAWHDQSAVERKQVDQLEQEVLSPLAVFPSVPEANFSVGFGHIFAGGYSAGYYSYKWAEVLDADAFEAFKEKGLYDEKTATDFKTHILQRGGTKDPAELYRAFRGRDADPKALMKRSGLLEEASS